MNDLLRPAAVARQDQKFEALIRLHARAVRTASEVLILLRSGYSAAAFARWRTLHEIRIVLVVLADGNEELIRRYLAPTEMSTPSKDKRSTKQPGRPWDTNRPTGPPPNANRREQN